jgi:mannose-1-phosphate guanylyltransferase
MRHAIVMAGGSGTRFWPLSRNAQPKQLLPLWEGRTLVELTVERLARVTALERIFIVTGEHLAEPIAAVLPDLPRANIIVEPAARNTLPCVALAAAVLEQRDPDASFGVFAADAWIDGADAFAAACERGWEAADQGLICTIGVRPNRPETGYGYIRQATGAGEVRPVDAFVEKPDLETATRYLAAGDYFWNAGIFFLSVATLWRELERQRPDMRRRFADIGEALGRGDAAAARASFERVESISIDYGIMEGAEGVVVTPATFEWNDVGHWGALDEVLGSDAAGNVIGGPVCAIDTEGSVLFAREGGDRLLAVLGMRDVVVVETEDATLVMPKEQAQRVRDVVAWIKERGRSDLL